MQLVILYGLKGIYIIRHASLEDKPGVDYRENELKKELETGKETTTFGEFLKKFLIHFEIVELHNMCTVRKTGFLSFLTTLIEV